MNPSDGFPHKPSKGYSYAVKEHKRKMVSIWLRNHTTFSYTSEPVRTILGFYNTKKGCYHAPINSTKQGDQVDISSTTPYSAMQLNLNPLMQCLMSPG